ncbi:MAG TPA: MmcQ/YjbR family DNA-binding protein [Gemmatirosa sp.]
MPRDPLSHLRALCLALPEAHEALAWGAPTFRVRHKLFAMYASPGTHHGNGRPAVWIKARPANQAFMVQAAPRRVFIPPYVGVSGWVGVWLDRRPPWGGVAGLLRDAYCQAAPQRLAAQLTAATAPGLARPARPAPGQR